MRWYPPTASRRGRRQTKETITGSAGERGGGERGGRTLVSRRAAGAVGALGSDLRGPGHEAGTAAFL